jgi:Uncharacterised nucleotidyltransferase
MQHFSKLRLHRLNNAPSLIEPTRGRSLQPTPSDIALLRAALLDGEQARSAYKIWRERLDWERLPGTWKRLIPLLHENARRLGLADSLLERFGGVRRYYWARNLRLMELAKQVHLTFAQAGVPALALKGTSLVAAAYVDRSVRPMEDIDVLVNRARVKDAIRVLNGLGFAPHGFTERCLLERLAVVGELPGCAFVNVKGEYVDLHWNAMHLDRRVNADDAAWIRSNRITFEGVGINVLHPNDQLLQLCAHGIQDMDSSAIRWIADAAIVIRASPMLDWSAFVKCAAFHRLSASLADALTLLKRNLSLPIPDWVVNQLRRQSSFEERSENRLWQLPAHAWGSGMTRMLLQLSAFRRGRSDLFDRSVVFSVGPCSKTLMGTQTVRGALGRAWYLRSRDPKVRAHFARDRALNRPPVSQLPVISNILDLSLGQAPEVMFVHGWSFAERTGRWTDGPFATLAWKSPSANAALTVSIVAEPAVHADHPAMDVEIFVRDTKVAYQHYEYGSYPAQQLSFSIPEHLREADGIVQLTFEIVNPLVPIAKSISPDTRALGLHLRRIEVRECTAPYLTPC